MLEQLVRSQLISTAASPTTVIVNMYMPFCNVFIEYFFRNESKHVLTAKSLLRLDKFGIVELRKMFRNSKILFLHRAPLLTLL